MSNFFVICPVILPLLSGAIVAAPIIRALSLPLFSKPKSVGKSDPTHPQPDARFLRGLG